MTPGFLCCTSPKFPKIVKIPSWGRSGLYSPGLLCPLFLFLNLSAHHRNSVPSWFPSRTKNTPTKSFYVIIFADVWKIPARGHGGRKPRPPTSSGLLAPSPSAVPHRFPLEVQFTFHYCAELLGNKNLQLLFLFCMAEPQKRISSQEGLPLDRSLSVQKPDMVIKTFFFLYIHLNIFSNFMKPSKKACRPVLRIAFTSL